MPWGAKTGCSQFMSGAPSFLQEGQWYVLSIIIPENQPLCRGLLHPSQGHLKVFCPAHPPVQIERGEHERRLGAARAHLSRLSGGGVWQRPTVTFKWPCTRLKKGRE